MSKKTAWLFPGQGSQSMGMLRSLATAFPMVEQTFAEASTILGYDLWQLVQQGPAEQLDQTIHTQPALLAAGVAVWRVWQQQRGPEPMFMAGHSLGEYTALVCADALEFASAVALVAERAKLMQAAVPVGQGAMAAIIGLSEQQVLEVCEAVAMGEVITPANYNAQGQIVIAGHRPAVQRAATEAKQRGAKLAILLAVSVPSHCPLMAPAAAQFATAITAVNLRPPRIPVVQNVDAAIHSEPEVIKQLLINQLASPVRWLESMQYLAQAGVELAIEGGPGKVLAGLSKRIEPSVQTLPIYDVETLTAVLTKIS